VVWGLSFFYSLSDPRSISIIALSKSTPMSSIFCFHLKNNLPAMQKSPYSGPLGSFLLERISQPAWDLWKAHQIKIINEYKLSPLNPQDKERLKLEMLQFFQIPDSFEA